MTARDLQADAVPETRLLACSSGVVAPVLGDLGRGDALDVKSQPRTFGGAARGNLLVKFRAGRLLPAMKNPAAVRTVKDSLVERCSVEVTRS